MSVLQLIEYQAARSTGSSPTQARAGIAVRPAPTLRLFTPSAPGAPGSPLEWAASTLYSAGKQALSFMQGIPAPGSQQNVSRKQAVVPAASLTVTKRGGITPNRNITISRW